MEWKFKYFNRREFTCRCCGQLPPTAEEHYYYMVFYFLESFRKWVDRPIIIYSGYRCPKHNREVGGVARSYHTIPKNPTPRHPCAIDFYVPGLNGTACQDTLYGFISLSYCGYKLYQKPNGLYFIHLDFRGSFAKW